MSNQRILEDGSRYVMNTYGRYPVAMVRGEGCKIWDADGNEYLDFVGGLAVNSLGHSHPRVAQAVARQVETLIHCSNLYWIEPQVELARLLVENSCHDKVFFCNSGAEANEAAIKLARKWGKLHLGNDHYEIITMRYSFHGRTLATVTATGQEKFHRGFEPLPAGFTYVPFNDLEALRQTIGPHTCAVMLEPVQGEGGVNLAGEDYLAGVADLCRKHGLLLIFDEVQCGLGRTGHLFAYQHYGVEPDIMTLAKALAGGVPIGAMLAREDVAAAFVPGDHASTFGGNPLASSAGVAAFSTILEEKLPAKAAETGAYFMERLQEIARDCPLVVEIRGRGLILGMELGAPGTSIVQACMARGLLINCVNNNTLRFLPPLNITKEDVDSALAILEPALQEWAATIKP